MKYMITGGNRGLGLALCQHFSGDSYSRETGHDITKHVEILAQTSLQYDVFVNNAFDGPFHEPWANFAQTQLLYRVAYLWRQQHKIGWIINIGSVGSESTVAPDPTFETYRVSKIALKSHSRQWTRAFKEGRVLFRTSLLTLDRLDTDLTRSRDDWSDNGIDCQDVCAWIELLTQTQPNTCIEEIVAWVALNHKHT